MKEGYRLLGDFIQPVDERNRDLRVDYLLGVSISKQFIPSIANIVGTDLSNYKIIRTGQFAYGPVTSRNGEKISIALLRDKDCIISSSYTVFEVVNKNELDPEYLMLWFSRPEFDATPDICLTEVLEKSLTGMNFAKWNCLFTLLISNVAL